MSNTILKILLIVAIVSIIGLIFIGAENFYSSTKQNATTNTTTNESAEGAEQEITNSPTSVNIKTILIVVGIILFVIGIIITVYVVMTKQKQASGLSVAEPLSLDDVEMIAKAYVAKKINVPVLKINGEDFVKDDHLHFTGEKLEWDNPNGTSMVAFELECRYGEYAGKLLTVKVFLNQTLTRLKKGNKISLTKDSMFHWKKYEHAPRRFPDYSHASGQLQAIQILSQADPEYLKEKLKIDDVFKANGKDKNEEDN